MNQPLIFFGAFLIFTAVILLYLWIIHPHFKKRELDILRSTRYFAHRGLWDLSKGIPENSMPAFQAAVANGYGIELDVHLTRDRKLVVFHDNSLKRICGVKGTPETSTYDELCVLRLSGTEERIPLLSEVLSMVSGRVPLLIEMKLPDLSTGLCSYLKDELSRYEGPFLIESFNPLGLRRIRKELPDVMTGQLATKYGAKVRIPYPLKIASAALLFHVISRPDFIAYNFRAADGLSLTINRRLYHTPTFAWTIRSEEDLKVCDNEYDAIIFEHCLPRISAHRGHLPHFTAS